ncbi:MAG: type I restriction-modification system subunit M N-terminal domain-containing protein, partial [Dolichospermum sp.]
MSDEQRRQLQQQLWNIADTLRGKMNADEFRDYILGFIFYKYLSEKIENFADKELSEDGLKFAELKEDNADDAEIVEAVREATVKTLGYFLKPSELFKAIAKKGNNGVSDDEDTNEESKKKNFILNDLSKILKNIEQSTLGTESVDDFSNLF